MKNEEKNVREEQLPSEEPKRKLKRSVKKKMDGKEQEKQDALEQMLSLKKRNRRILWGSVIGAVVVLIALVILFHPATGIVQNYRPDPIVIDKMALTPSEAAKAKKEYEEDDKSVKFEYGKLTRMLTEENYAEMGDDDPGKFFKEFIDTIKAGDWQAYQSFFVDGYFDKNEKQDKMTPQKLYHVEVLYNDSSENITMGDKSYNVENFKVRYKILENDFTYRADMRGNQWVPQIFQVAKTEDGYRIVNVIYVIQ